jgi:hypothetical protein
MKPRALGKAVKRAIAVGEKTVAQVSKPAVSQRFQPANVAKSNSPSELPHAADRKSAIQSRCIGKNLGYDLLNGPL